MTDAWEHAANWSGDMVPGSGDQVRILDGSAVILSSSVSILGILIDGNSSLTIIAGGTLTTTGDSPSSGDGVSIKTGSSLIINGILNISGCSGDGIDIDTATSSLTVGEDGELIINNIGNDNEDNGIEITGSFSNSGDVTIDSSGGSGIYVTGLQVGLIINNSGDAITISGAGTYGISLGNSAKSFVNNGIVTLSDAGTYLYEGPGDFMNGSTGVFKGDGTFNNAADFIDESGSTIAPGTSPGILTFSDNGTIDFSSGVIFAIEINGTTVGTEYDRIVSTNNLIISNSTLNLSGSHTPGMGDVFTIIDAGVNTITGTFNGLPDGSMINLNGEDLSISYTGNQVIAFFISPMPVELIDFSAQPMEGEVKLSWATATETNNDYYTLERSLDGRTFEAIAMVNGNGNTTEISNYIHMDKNPERGLNYYRLKQTDFDGQFSYSDIKTAELKTDEPIKVYPTIVSKVLTVETGDEFDGDVTIVIRDQTGRDVKSFPIPSKSNKMELSIDELIPGSYYVVIYYNEKSHTQKIIKL